MPNVNRRTAGRLVPAYPTETRSKYDGNPQKGFESATLTRSDGPVDRAAANELQARIERERAERLKNQGHA